MSSLESRCAEGQAVTVQHKEWIVAWCQQRAKFMREHEGREPSWFEYQCFIDSWFAYNHRNAYRDRVCVVCTDKLLHCIDTGTVFYDPPTPQWIEIKRVVIRRENKRGTIG